jgi:lysozyme
MSHRELVRAQLKIDEGTIPHAYMDSEGYWTIGVGRLIDKRLGGHLRPDEIDFLLDNDIARAEVDAKALIPSFDELSDVRKAVLVNMAFNLGRERLAAFQRFREAVAAQEWARAAGEMLDSRWAEQVGIRAQRLAKQMMEG